MDSVNIFDVLIIICGLYMVYTAFIMKTRGKITAGIVVSKDIDVEKIRDKQGFINYMFGKVLLLGVLTAVIGVMGIISTYINAPSYITLIGLACFMVILIVFAVASNKAKKLFIE